MPSRAKDAFFGGTFNYGPDMQRYQQQLAVGGVNTATTSYVGGLFEVIAQGSAVQYRHTIMAAGGVVAVHTLDVSGNPTTTYIHSDHLGSSDTFTDETGSLAVYPGTAQAQTMSFDAFGMRRDPTNWQYDLTVPRSVISRTPRTRVIRPRSSWTTWDSCT